MEEDMSGHSTAAKDEHLKHAWRRFVEHHSLEDNDKLRPVILSSWKRCSSLHVNPWQKSVPNKLEETELAKLKREHREFLRSCMSILYELYVSIQNAPFVITVAAPSGIILKTIGNSDALEMVRQGNYVEGADTSSRVSAIEEAEDGKAQVIYEDKKGVHTLVSDKVLAAVGRKPFYESLMPEKAGVVTAERGKGIPVDAFMRTNVAHIYAIGDVTNRIQLAHCASHQGFTAVDHICGKEHEMNYEIIPNVIFTAPEIASVGMTEAKAKEAAGAGGPEYAVSKFPFAANGKAMTMQETSGFAKLICRKEDGKVLGGSIIGPDASSLAGVLSLAVSCGLKAEDIADTVFAHPTTAEAIGEAAMGFGKGMINF